MDDIELVSCFSFVVIVCSFVCFVLSWREGVKCKRLERSERNNVPVKVEGRTERNKRETHCDRVVYEEMIRMF